MKFNVTVDRDEGSVWIVECLSIPCCASQGETKAEALAIPKKLSGCALMCGQSKACR